MKLVTFREPLQQAIGTVRRAVSSRSTLPILSNILVEGDREGLTLSATDLEIGVRTWLKVDVEEPGRTTLPAALFAEVVGAMPPGGPLELQRDDKDHVTFRCGRSELEMHGLPADEFPVIPTIDAAARVELPQSLLKQMIGLCSIAVSHDDTRARLTGMLVQVEGDRLRLVATDTHRLATRSEQLPAAVDTPISVIVPARALREVERLLVDDDEQRVVVEVTDSQVQFRLEGVTIISRLIEGEFPNYRKVIPASFEWLITLPVAPLRDSVRRCAIVSREDNRKLVLRANPAGQLQLSAASSKIGRADELLEDVQVEVSNGADQLEIAFNADYLLDVLNNLPADELRLELTASNQPAAVRPVSDMDYVYVLMPMQM